MIRYIGVPPKSFLELCKRSGAFFDENGEYHPSLYRTDMLIVLKENGCTELSILLGLRTALKKGPRTRSSSTSFDVLCNGIRGRDPQPRNCLTIVG
jgi:hypothetical protein